MAVSTTTQLVPITEIRDGILFLKNGSIRAIVEVSAINFELRSDEEQAAVIQNFQGFLNSIDFPLQIIVNSRFLNLDNYIKYVETARESLTNELMRIQASEYSRFISEISQLANIMSKRFYISVPLYTLEEPTKTGIFKSILQKKQAPAMMGEEQFQKYRLQIMQRVELILDGLIGLGLKARTLETTEIIRLFYEFYNPPSVVKEEDNLATP